MYWSLLVIDLLRPTRRLLHRKTLCKLPCSPESFWLILLPNFSNLIVQGIIRIRGRKQGLNRKKHSPNLQRWRPLVFEDIQTNSSQLVDIRVINLGQESNFWWSHGIVSREKEFQLKDSIFIRRISWSFNSNCEIPQIIFVGGSTDTGDGFRNQTLCFLWSSGRKCEIKSTCCTIYLSISLDIQRS